MLEYQEQDYGDLTHLNREGLILRSIGRENLEVFVNDNLELLGTSSAIYEANGDYAFGNFTSGWCRMLDSASRRLCNTSDNSEALDSGRWLCHESCWTDCSKQSVADGVPIDIECNGGLRIYAIPILAQGNVVGAINFGYGDPPTDPEQLRKLAETYQLEYDDLVREADAYDSRPPFIIDLAKKRLHATARLIGYMIEACLAEETLRKSEETLRTTLHSVGDAVISTDMDGLVTSMNPVAESLTGWSEGEAIGQPLATAFRIVNEQTWQLIESPVTHVLESGQIVGLSNHTILIARDGREIPIADSGAPIRNDAGEITGVVLVFRDQTKERADREALEANYTLLQIAGETAGFGGWSVDLKNNICTWSDAVADIHEMPRGYAPPVQEGIDFYAPEWRAKIAEVFSACAEKGIPYDEEMEIFTRKGKRVWVRTIGRAVRDESGTIIKVQGSFQNITEHKQAEVSLKEREDRLSKIMLAANDGMWDWDLRTNSVYFDPRYYQMSGYEVDEFPYDLAEFQQRVHPDDVDSVMNEAEKHLRGEVDLFQVKFRFRKKSGDWQWIQGKGKIVERNEEGAPQRFVGTHRDISELKQVELDLVEQKDLLSAIYRNAPLVMMVVNAERRIQQINRFATQFADRDAEEPLGMRGGEALRCLHVLDDPEGCGFGTFCQQCIIRNTVLDTLETGKTYLQVESPYQFKGEDDVIRELQFLMSTTPIEVKGERMVLVTLQDISESKRVEQELQESEERFKALHNASFGGIVIHDKGLILECNQGLSDLTGYTYDELIGMDGLMLISENTRDKVVRNIEAGYEKPYEAEGVRKNGEIYPIRLEARKIRYKGKEVRVVEFRDISEIKQAEKEKAHLETQLLQAHKMESVGRLAGGVAHDFNNMLGVILGHAEMALDQLDPGQPLFADLQEIQRAGQRSAKLTRQLLAFARKQTITPRIIDLNETVEGMLQMLRRLIGEGIDLAWLPGKEPALVRVDPSQIDQILANLCLNARDAIADVGKITIETGVVSFDETYCHEHAGFLPGEYVLLAVSDTGCGMDSVIVEHIFEPFFTTKEQGKGTGLGLASVYGAVKQNEGFINVYSEPGQGTIFRVYLPRLQDGTSMQKDKMKATPNMRGNETILLVEDEPSILHVVLRMLENLGYAVMAAKTPTEAIRLASEHHGSIDLLITDVVMPEMNGRDLSKNLVNIHPGIKCLFMSGYTANVIAHHGALDPDVEFIQKPFSNQALSTKVREVIEKT
ncbi:MAG: PAS domain S-box protein [Anaerolineales bacterium]|nr:PAS domain S-box protein [Anaerolineales bacterium]